MGRIDENATQKYPTDLKADVSLEAIQEQHTMAELSGAYSQQSDLSSEMTCP